MCGTIGLFDQAISKVAYWVEDGDHVFRSLEFDVIAGAPTVDEAVKRFLDNAEDFADSIAELPSDELTHDEAEIGLMILHRFASAYQDGVRREEQRLRKLHLRRLLGRRPDSHRGFRPSSPQTSSPLQLA